MDFNDNEIGFEWHRLSANIDALVMRVASIRGYQLPLAGSALSGDDRATVQEPLTMDIWRLIERSVSYLHACRDLLRSGDPIEDGPGFVLIRACVETAAASYWIMNPARRDERLARYIQWRITDLRDSRTAWVAFTRSGSEEYTAAIERLKRIADVRPMIDAEKASVRLKSFDVISDVAEKVNVEIDLRFTWRLASALAHGRKWSDIGLQVLPLDTEEASLVSLTEIPSRTFPFARSAYLLCVACTNLFMNRVGLESGDVEDGCGEIRRLFTSR